MCRRSGRLQITHQRRIEECRHSDTITTVTAGLERTACESCGHVSVQFIESTVRLYPNAEIPTRSPRLCGYCDQLAVFLIPGGVACSQHAWVAAAEEQTMGSEPWIPISAN